MFPFAYLAHLYGYIRQNLAEFLFFSSIFSIQRKRSFKLQTQKRIQNRLFAQPSLPTICKRIQSTKAGKYATKAKLENSV